LSEINNETCRIEIDFDFQDMGDSCGDNKAKESQAGLPVGLDQFTPKNA
jgi:hypothetical protein